jgi:hypothetical protein
MDLLVKNWYFSEAFWVLGCFLGRMIWVWLSDQDKLKLYITHS